MQNQAHKCPWCSCLFFNRRDLTKHILAFGEDTQHSEKYRKTHAGLERGYGDE